MLVLSIVHAGWTVMPSSCRNWWSNNFGARTDFGAARGARRTPSWSMTSDSWSRRVEMRLRAPSEREHGRPRRKRVSALSGWRRLSEPSSRSRAARGVADVPALRGTPSCRPPTGVARCRVGRHNRCRTEVWPRAPGTRRCTGRQHGRRAARTVAAAAPGPRIGQAGGRDSQ